MENLIKKLNTVEFGVSDVLSDDEIATAKLMLELEAKELNERKSKANFYELNFNDCESTEIFSDEEMPILLGGEFYMIDEDTRSYIGLVDNRPVLVREHAEPIAERIGSYRFLSLQGYGYYANNRQDNRRDYRQNCVQNYAKKNMLHYAEYI